MAITARTAAANNQGGEFCSIRWRREGHILRADNILVHIVIVDAIAIAANARFAPPAVDRLVEQGVPPRAAQRMVREEAVQCLARAL